MFNVLIASPRDIFVERKIVREICSGINEGVLPNHFGITFKVTRWEDVFSSATSSQDIIKKLSEEFDIFVCIFYKKLCTFPDQGATDSLEKFLSAYDSWKSLKKPYSMFFFKEMKKPTLKELNDPQYKKVLELREKIKNNDLLVFEDFSAPYEFCAKVHDYIEDWATEHMKSGSG